MRAVIQRAKRGQVAVAGEVVGQIEQGIVVLLGVTHTDTEEDVTALVDKLIHLRIFEDDFGKMNRSLRDVDGSILSISQFTLYGDIRKGRRPSFVKAATPEHAKELYELFNEQLRRAGIHVATGIFGAKMAVDLINDGPVTLLIETKAGKVVDINDYLL